MEQTEHEEQNLDLCSKVLYNCSTINKIGVSDAEH